MSSPEQPKTNQSEQGPEHIPSQAEILILIGKRCELPESFKTLSDEKGVYLLEARTPEDKEKPGEYTLYVYQRKGTFPGQNAAAATVLEAVYFLDDKPCGGDIVAELDPQTNEWIEK